MSQVVGSNSSYKPITNTTWVRARLFELQKGCTRLAAASDQVYQFSPGTPASSTTTTGLHDIAEILLKVTPKSKSNQTSIQYPNGITIAIMFQHIPHGYIYTSRLYENSIFPNFDDSKRKYNSDCKHISNKIFPGCRYITSAYF